MSSPKMVLLPGMDGTGKLFTDFVKALPSEFATVVASYPCDRHLSDDELLAMVETFCPTVEPFVLLAESFSAPVAIKYAARAPANMKGLVLCVGFARSPVKGWRRWMASLLAPVLSRRIMSHAAMRFWLCGWDAPSSLVRMVYEAVSSVRSAVLASRIWDVLTWNVSEEFAQVSVPILYIQASGDRLVPSSCLEEMLRIKPGLSSEKLDGPHLILQRHPQRAADVVAKFISQLPH